jgi:hypothetical protein
MIGRTDSHAKQEREKEQDRGADQPDEHVDFLMKIAIIARNSAKQEQKPGRA